MRLFDRSLDRVSLHGNGPMTVRYVRFESLVGRNRITSNERTCARIDGIRACVYSVLWFTRYFNIFPSISKRLPLFGRKELIVFWSRSFRGRDPRRRLSTTERFESWKARVDSRDRYEKSLEISVVERTCRLASAAYHSEMRSACSYSGDDVRIIFKQSNALRVAISSRRLRRFCRRHIADTCTKCRNDRFVELHRRARKFRGGNSKFPKLCETPAIRSTYCRIRRRQP